MESFKKYLKLLCCVFITLFMFGFGGEKVLAEPQTITVPRSKNVEEQSWYYKKLPDGTYDNSLVKRDQEGHYVFCLDSHQRLYDGEMSIHTFTESNDLFDNRYEENYKEKVARIVANAYRLGLDNGDATHTIAFESVNGKKITMTISEKDFYGVTQSAIWSVVHRENADGGYTQEYKSWVEDNHYEALFNELKTEYSGRFDLVVDKSAEEFKADLNDADKDNYYYSEQFTLTYGGIPSTVDIQVKGPELGERDDVQIMINNDGIWKTLNNEEGHSYTVKSGGKFVTRALKPSTGSSDYRFTISTGLYSGKSNVYFYNSPDGFQNIVLATKIEDAIDNRVKKYRFNAETNDKKIITVKKIEKKVRETDPDIYIGNATLELYIPQPSNVATVLESIATFDSLSPTGSNLTPVKTFSVEVGRKYCVREISAPYGYLLSSTPVCKDITNESEGTDLEFTMENEKLKVKFRKVDANGKGIEGVKIKIVNYVENTVTQNTDDAYICAITDSNGYFTRPCTEGGSISQYYAGGGEFYYEPGETEERIGNMYYIQEEFNDGYYVKAFDANDPKHATTQDFYLSDKVFFTEYSASNNIRLIGELGTENVPTINIINDRYLKFTKEDTGSGKEIAGAKMHLYDVSVSEKGLSDKEDRFVHVAVWESDGTPYIVQNIIPGHTYELVEEYAPKDYLKLQTAVRFRVNEDGLVEDISTDQTLVKTKNDNLRWIVIGNDLYPDAPNTGISLLNTIAIGGLMVFVGYEAIKIYRKRTA